MNGLFLSGDTKSEENGNVNAKVKTNLLRAWNWTSDLRIANISSTVLRSTNWAIEGLDTTTTHTDIRIANTSSTVLCSTSWDIERWENPQATTTDQEIQKPNLLRFLREIGLRFVVNASRALLKKHHLFSETSWCNSSTSDCWSEGCVIKSLRGQVISYWHEMSNMKKRLFRYRIDLDFIYRLFFNLAIRSPKKNGNVNAKVKTNLLRAGIEPAT